MLIKWRTSDRINSKMLTNVQHITHEQQLKWINSLYHKPFGYSWISCADGKDIGYVSIDINGANNDEGTFGFYIYDTDYSVMGFLEVLNVLNLLCSIDRVKKQYSFVKTDNKKVYEMHLSVGFEPITEEEKKIFHYPIPEGFSLLVWHGEENGRRAMFADDVAEFPVKLWHGRDASVTSKFFIY